MQLVPIPILHGGRTKRSFLDMQKHGTMEHTVITHHYDGIKSWENMVYEKTKQGQAMAYTSVVIINHFRWAHFLNQNKTVLKHIKLSD